MVSAKFFERLLLLGVGLLMPRTARLELDLASPEELTYAVGVSVLDAVSFSKELVGLADGCDLPPLHGLLQILERLGRDQLLTTALAHPALEELLDAALLVALEPPLALTPGVAQCLGCFPQVTAFLGL
jgi:hypothetical protein